MDAARVNYQVMNGQIQDPIVDMAQSFNNRLLPSSNIIIARILTWRTEGMHQGKIIENSYLPYHIE